MKRVNTAVSLIRVIAMLSIILGHVCTEYGINTYQFGGIGVEIFLFISGYLYGKKVIPNSINWVEKRWKRLIPPLWWTVGICLALTAALKASFNWKSIIEYLFCAQGVSRIAFNIKLPTLSGMGQTWFLTVLVVCYILMLMLKKNKRIEDRIDKNLVQAGILAAGIQMALCFTGIQIVYILQFFAGYFLSRLDTKENQNVWVNKKTVFALTIASIAFSAVRLAANRFIDGTIFYDRIIARWSFAVIAVWLISIQILICKYRWAEKLVKSKTWKVLDMASYPLFLTHYMFLTGPMKVMDWFKSVPLQLLMFASFTALIAIVIVLLTERKRLAIIIRGKEDRG